MAKKYEKIGQADIYREKKEIGCAPIIGGCFLAFIILVMLSQCAEGSTPSPLNPLRELVPISEGSHVYRYEAGNSGESAMKLAARMSLSEDPYFVIFVAYTDRHETPAIEHAKKLSVWFRGNIGAIDREVPIVLYPNDRGVGYTFYISGIRYSNEELTSDGIMNPQQSAASRQDVSTTYYAQMILRERGEYDFLVEN